MRMIKKGDIRERLLPTVDKGLLQDFSINEALFLSGLYYLTQSGNSWVQAPLEELHKGFLPHMSEHGARNVVSSLVERGFVLKKKGVGRVAVYAINGAAMTDPLRAMLAA